MPPIPLLVPEHLESLLAPNIALMPPTPPDAPKLPLTPPRSPPMPPDAFYTPSGPSVPRVSASPQYTCDTPYTP